MTQKDLVQFWSDGADEAWKTVQSLMESKRHLHALFFCHLALEKLLKAKCVARHDHAPPPVHALVWLADEAGTTLSEEERTQLAQITKFNIAGRYEDYKLALHKQATEEYARRWAQITETLLHAIRQR